MKLKDIKDGEGFTLLRDGAKYKRISGDSQNITCRGHWRKHNPTRILHGNSLVLPKETDE